MAHGALGAGLAILAVAGTCCCAVIALRQCRRPAADGSDESRWKARFDEAARVPKWALTLGVVGLPAIVAFMSWQFVYEETLQQLSHIC